MTYWAIKRIQAQPCQPPGTFWYMHNKGWVVAIGQRTLYSNYDQAREMFRGHWAAAAVEGQLLPIPLHKLVRVPVTHASLRGVVMAPESPWTERIMWSVIRLNPNYQDCGNVIPYYYRDPEHWTPDTQDRLLFEGRLSAQAVLWAQRERWANGKDPSTNTVFKIIRVKIRHRVIKRGV